MNDDDSAPAASLKCNPVQIHDMLKCVGFSGGFFSSQARKRKRLQRSTLVLMQKFQFLESPAKGSFSGRKGDAKVFKLRQWRAKACGSRQTDLGGMIA